MSVKKCCMNGQNAKKAARLIQEIAQGGGSKGIRYPIMSGNVVAGSVDTDMGTCTVLMDIDDPVTSGTAGVTINVWLQDANGFMLYPKDESAVLVAEVNGPGMWSIIKCSDLVKVLVTIDNNIIEMDTNQIQLTQGAAVMTIAGGCFNFKNGSKNLTTIMQNILDHIQQLKVGTGTGPSTVPINVSDFAQDLEDVNSIFN